MAAVLVLLDGLLMALVAFGNISDFETNQLFVRHVLSMDTTNFGAEPGSDLDPDVMWRAIDNETVQHVAYLLIIAWETLSAVVLLGSLALWISDGASGYARARAASTIGLLMVIALFFGGFIVIGGEWFQMWRSEAWNGLDPAFRNSMLAMVTLVAIHLPSRQWERVGVAP